MNKVILSFRNNTNHYTYNWRKEFGYSGMLNRMPFGPGKAGLIYKGFNDQEIINVNKEILIGMVTDKMLNKQLEAELQIDFKNGNQVIYENKYGVLKCDDVEKSVDLFNNVLTNIEAYLTFDN